jgi:2-aminoethylphosphonate transport system ATP-binding protein
MRDGKLVALGASQQLYRHPPNRFTAEFLGRANLLPVDVDASVAANGHLHVRFAGTPLTVASHNGSHKSKQTLVCIRPHALRVAENGSGNRLAATVANVLWQGDHHAVTLDCQGTALRMVMPPLRDPPVHGTRLDIAFSPDDATLIAEG